MVRRVENSMGGGLSAPILLSTLAPITLCPHTAFDPLGQKVIAARRSSVCVCVCVCVRIYRGVLE